MSKRDRANRQAGAAEDGILQISTYVRWHLAVGWWSLLVFLSLGVVLEAMHGLKVGWYLEIQNETRRLMWTLAHAHGTLLALIHVAFAATLFLLPGQAGSARRVASAMLTIAGLLLPVGFFLGGVWIYGGDPGLGILLVPLGALFLFSSVLLTAIAATKKSS